MNAFWEAPLPAATCRAETTVTVFKADKPPTTPVKMMLLTPAVRSKSNVPFSVPPKVMAAPAREPPALVLSTIESSVKVTPPMPKFSASPLLMMVAATFEAAPPVKFMPPLNRNVSVVTLPKVTRPLLRKSIFTANVLFAPVMITAYGLAVVIKSFT